MRFCQSRFTHGHQAFDATDTVLLVKRCAFFIATTGPISLSTLAIYTPMLGMWSNSRAASYLRTDSLTTQYWVRRGCNPAAFCASVQDVRRRTISVDMVAHEGTDCRTWITGCKIGQVIALATRHDDFAQRLVGVSKNYNIHTQE